MLKSFQIKLKKNLSTSNWFSRISFIDISYRHLPPVERNSSIESRRRVVYIHSYIYLSLLWSSYLETAIDRSIYLRVFVSISYSIHLFVRLRDRLSPLHKRLDVSWMSTATGSFWRQVRDPLWCSRICAHRQRWSL